MTTVELLWSTDKVEKRDGSFFHVETGEELEQAPAKMSKSLKNVVNPDDVVDNTVPIPFVSMKCSWGHLMLPSLGQKKVWKEAVNSWTVFTV